MSKKYLDKNNEAPSLPIAPAIWMATAFKVWGAPEWLWGVFGLLYVVGFIYAFYKIFTYEKVEL